MHLLIHLQTAPYHLNPAQSQEDGDGLTLHRL